MQMDFFYKKRWIYILFSQIFVGSFILFLAYSAFMARVESVYHGRAFYFLVTEANSVAVGSWDARLNGGAGYPLSVNNETCIVMSVYLNEEDCKNVLTALQNTGEDVSLIAYQAERLYFKSKEAKRNKDGYIGAFNSLYGAISVLEQMINRLDGGMTQAACQRTLMQLVKVLEYNAAAYQESFPAYAQVCKVAGKRLHFIAENTVYTKDLRYALCDLAIKYLKLTKLFAL